MTSLKVNRFRGKLFFMRKKSRKKMHGGQIISENEELKKRSNK